MLLLLLLKQDEQNGHSRPLRAIVLAVGRTSHSQAGMERSPFNVVGFQTRAWTQPEEADTRADRSSRTTDLHRRDSQVPMDRIVGSS